MQVAIRLSDYQEALTPHLDEPLSLNGILEPFGIDRGDIGGREDQQLRVMDFLLALQLEYQDPQNPFIWLDPVDVCLVAVSLGFEEAIDFIEIAPGLVARAVRAGRGIGVNV